MTSRTYFKTFSDISWDVAHLYEHAFIYEYQKRLRKTGLIAQVTSSISGETFEAVIFIDMLFRTDEAASLMQYHLNSEAAPSEESIAHAIKSIENEERSNATVSDTLGLSAQLKVLAETPWQSVEAIEPTFVDDRPLSSTNHPLTLEPNKKDFINLEVIVSLKDASIEEAATFNRLSGFVIDAICEEIGLRHQAYFDEDDSLVRLDIEQLCFTSRIGFTVKSSVKSADIKNAAQAGVSKLLDDENMKAIQEALHAWADDPRAYSVIKDYYRYSGLLAGAKDIENLASIERIKSILGKLKIDIAERTV